MTNNELGLRLKELRLIKAQKLGRRKITQAEVAAYLNISPGAYGSWESGRTKPDVMLLPKIADYFGISIDLLFNRSMVPETVPAPIVDKTALTWSLRRRINTNCEQLGLEAWRLLCQGESLASISAELNTRSTQEIESYVKSVIYTDVVSIDHFSQDIGLATRVQQQYGLREVMVVPVAKEAPFLFRNILLGEAARSYFKMNVSEGMKVGLAGGYSVGRLVYSLRREEVHSVELYPLAISPVIEAIALDANSLVGAFAYRHDGCDVRGYTLQYASPLAYKNPESIRQFAPTLRILAKAKSVDIAFMGLGMVGRRRSPIDLLGDLVDTITPGLKTIHQRGVVGDILYHLVNQEGRPVVPEISNMICSIELQDLQEMVQLGIPVVVIASGQRKRDIARTAIKAGYANVFIIDSDLAQALLAEKQGGYSK